MKYIFKIVIACFTILIFSQCKKENKSTETPTPTPQLATISTTSISLITQTTAQSGGNISSDGGAPVTQRGVCWSTNQNPTTSDNITLDGSGNGSFTSAINTLSANTTYYVRAYAINSAGTAYGQQISFTNSGAPSYLVGQNYGGGIIFYIDNSGLHGLISATSDQGSGEWGCLGTTIGGTSTSISSGQANTTAIINGCSTIGIAARICDNLNFGGYNDWYLPSKDELNLMYQQRTVIGGFGATDYYWSSSENSSSPGYLAWRQDFDTGFQDGSGSKNFTANKIRAIRSF